MRTGLRQTCQIHSQTDLPPRSAAGIAVDPPFPARTVDEGALNQLLVTPAVPNDSSKPRS